MFVYLQYERAGCFLYPLHSLPTYPMKSSEVMRWEAYEHKHVERGSDWFWALGIIAASTAITAIIFANILFAILIVIAAITLGLLATREPKLFTFELSARGIRAGSHVFPFSSIRAFWIEEEDRDEPILLVDTDRIMAPDLVIPLPPSVNPQEVRSFLLEHTEEKELHESIPLRILEFFGF